MRRSQTIFMAGIALALPTLALAQGCGPTRLKVTETVTLDAPPAKVWALIGNFQDMSWDVEAVATSGSGGNIPETALRNVTLKGGATFGESLYKYDADAMSYSYHTDKVDLDRLPVQNLSATLEVVSDDGGAKTIVRWKGAFYRNLKPGEGPPDLADLAAVRAVQSFFRAGLDGLKAKADAKT